MKNNLKSLPPETFAVVGKNEKSKKKQKSYSLYDREILPEDKKTRRSEKVGKHRVPCRSSETN